MKRPIALAALVTLLVLVGLSTVLITRHPAVQAAKVPSPLLGHLAPPITGPALLPAVSSQVPQVTSLANERGHIVVLNFWSSWCGPCKVEAPELSTFAWNERHHNVVVLGVLFNDSVTSAQNFSHFYGSLYQTVVDPGGVDANRYGVTSPPTTFIIDSSGRIAAELLGATTAQQLTQAIGRVQ